MAQELRHGLTRSSVRFRKVSVRAASPSKGSAVQGSLLNVCGGCEHSVSCWDLGRGHQPHPASSSLPLGPPIWLLPSTKPARKSVSQQNRHSSLMQCDRGSDIPSRLSYLISLKQVTGPAPSQWEGIIKGGEYQKVSLSPTLCEVGDGWERTSQMSLLGEETV